jgi:hypothetical protein
MISSTAAGRSATCELAGSSSSVSFLASVTLRSWSNARLPTMASQKTSAAAWTSARRSTMPFSISCSGAMYASLPRKLPSFVVAVIRRSARAMPKSTSRAMPSAETITFCGDISRWMMLSGSPSSPLVSCAAWSPVSALTMICATIPSGGASPRRRAADRSSARLSPCTYSITRSTSRSTDTTSSTGTTFGCSILAAIRASSRKRLTTSGSCPKVPWRRLTATVRLKPAGPSSRPTCTEAMPPRAISS